MGHLSIPNICMMGERGEERKKGAEKVFEEIMAEKFPNLLKNFSPPGSSVNSK